MWCKNQSLYLSRFWKDSKIPSLKDTMYTCGIIHVNKQIRNSINGCFEDGVFVSISPECAVCFQPPTSFRKSFEEISGINFSSIACSKGYLNST